MKANELMIGDWVDFYHFYELENKIVTRHRVTEIFECGLVGISNHPNPVHADHIEPVKITQEILEKNGFTKSTPPPGIHARCYELDNKKDRYNLTIAEYNKYKRLLLNVDSEDSECFNIKCDYVHQLQHALRLCRIEKEIIL